MHEKNDFAVYLKLQLDTDLKINANKALIKIRLSTFYVRC